MTSDPSTLSPAPVPAADTHSSHSLCLTVSVSPLVFLGIVPCLFICIYTDTKLTYLADSFPEDGLWGSGFQLCCLSLFHLSLSFCDAHILRLFSSWILKSLLERHNRRSVWDTSRPSHSFVSLFMCGLVFITCNWVNLLIFLVMSLQIH